MELKEALTYEDILLVPQYSDIESRKDVDIGNNLDKKIHLSLPIISAPMDTVTESAMAAAIHEHGGLGIVHRYNSIEKQAALVREARNLNACAHSPDSEVNVGAAVGITGDFEQRAEALVAAGASVICVDVAHGHHKLVRRAIKTLKHIRSAFGDHVHIMAGNVATAEGYLALSSWGADSVRCNVGGGSICSTRIQTGHGVPGLQTILECAKVKNNKTKIIADGGIRSSGDIVKAIAVGADFVMLGSMLAGTDESPGEVLVGVLNTKRKVYRGMASKEAQFDWRGKSSSNEGISATIPYKGKVENILIDLDGGIRSGFSYSGAKDIKEFQEKVKFIKQTLAGQAESGTHILGK